MNFNAPLLKPVRILLFPFSVVYGFGVWVRNMLFDKGVLSSAEFNIPIIGVGNLTAGGTGKSSMVEFLMNRFRHRYNLAVLSRGYKRKTKGYALAADSSTSLDIGDEPLQFYKKYPAVAVAVGEERIVAIPQLLHDRPDTEVIILDDAFQHRYVKAGYDILLTDCNNLFTRDWFLPTGDLRDLSRNYRRADVLVVTKCAPGLSEVERDELVNELRPLPHQSVFFTSIVYGAPFHLLNGSKLNIGGKLEVLLVSGIANPRPLKKYLADHAAAYYEILYSDHHIFTIDDWKDIRKRFDGIQAAEKIILTTEKDSMRLTKFAQSMAGYPVYVIPIEIEFLFGCEKNFTELISTFINGFARQNE